jgi:hypothetical protein
MAKVDTAYPVVTPEETAKRKAIIANQDPSRFIFPAGQAAPSGVAPALPVEITPEQAAIQATTIPVPVQRNPAMGQTEEEFVNQESSQPAQAELGASSIANKFSNAMSMEAAAQENLGKQESEVLAKQSEMINKNIQEAQALQQKNDNELAEIETERKVAQNDLDSKKIEPHGFFHNKSGWEKVIGGIGLFLGSITPEGARNVASIVNKEIERDTESQKLDYQLRKGKVDAISNRYKANIDKYKDDQLARLAMQREKLLATDYQLKGLQAAAKGPMARAKAEAGKAEIEMKIAEAEQKMFDRKQKMGNAEIPGYSGVITDPVSAREFRTMVSEAPSVLGDVDTLLDINKQFLGGALSPSARATADSAALRLQGGLRVAMLGPGTVNDSERQLLEDAISNPTNLFSLKGSNKIRLESLKKAYQNKIDANAKALGLTKNTPTGARKI